MILMIEIISSISEPVSVSHSQNWKEWWIDLKSS